MGSADANATWKAISTLEWKKKQKKPAAAPNVGAILGEAADLVVGKYANSGGHASSPYLNRLSEIQIQDEAHIYQQLVKPEEVKPKRPPHRLFIGKGSRSSRGLKISGSRKVRFEGGEGSPTHKAALVAAAAGGGASKATAGATSSPEPAAAAAGAGKSVRIARTSSDSSSSSPKAPAKAGRRAGGVRFDPRPASSSSSSSTPAPLQQQQQQQQQKDTARQQPVTSVQGEATGAPAQAGAAAAASGNGSSNNSSSGANTQPVLGQTPAGFSHPATAAGAGSSSGRFPVAALPAAQQRSPSPLPQRQPSPSPGSSESGTAPRSHQHTRTGSSLGEQHSTATGDSAIMNRFLQQQPYGLDSPGSSSGGNRTHSMDYTALMAERQGGAVVMAGARAARRGSTDLVDKQLQWLRDSTYSAGSSSSSSGSSAGGSVPVMAPQQLGPSSSTSPAVPPHPAQADVTLNMGYRPIAIPTELFERWSNMGTTTKPAAAAAVAVVGGSGSGSGSSSALASKAASRRTTGTLEAAAAAAGKQGASAGSPFASRPTSGHETVAAGVGGGAPHAASRAAAGGGGGAGSMLQDSAAEGGYSVPSRRLSAGGGGVQEGRRHSVPTRQRTADSYTLHTLTASSKPPASSSNKQPGRPQASGLAPTGSLATARSLPSSGRASPALEPSSPKSHMATASGGNSSNGGGGNSSGGGRLSGGNSGSSSWQTHSRSSIDKHGMHSGPGGSGSSAQHGAGGLSGAGGGVGGPSGSARRSSRATGSTSSSHGDAEGDSSSSNIRWELQAGRTGVLGQPTGAATAGQQSNGSSSGGLRGGERGAAVPPTGSLGVRQGSSSLAGHVKVHLPEIGGPGGRAAQRH